MSDIQNDEKNLSNVESNGEQREQCHGNPDPLSRPLRT
jgi:hypothetical protein